MKDTAAAPGHAAYRDASGGLIFFGICFILLGIFFLLLGGLSVLGVYVQRTAGVVSAGPVSPVTSAIVAAVTYATMAAGAIWLGVGSLMARRWARALALLLSLLTLLGGGSGTLFVGGALWVRRDMLRAALPDGGGGPAAVGIAFAALLVFVMYVVIPTVTLLFFRRASVRLTCEARNPNPAWTDRCPLPVLGASLALLFGGVQALGGLVYPVVPFFGRLLTGSPAQIVQALTGVAALLAAWWLYRLQVRGWWLSGLLLVGGSLSLLVTFQWLPPSAWADALQVPATDELQRLLVEAVAAPMAPWAALCAIVATAFLLYIRKFLPRPEDGP